MKKSIFLAMFLLVFLAGNVFAGKMIYNGYGPQEFALKAELLKKLDNVFTEIKNANLNLKSAKASLFFTIIGSASADGEVSKNDEYGLLRANQVKAYLSGHFPNARFDVYSVGSLNDCRQVEVQWQWIDVQEESISTIQPKKSPVQTKMVESAVTEKKENRDENLTAKILIIVFFPVALFISFLIYILRRKKTEPFEIEGVEYIYCPEIKNGKFQGLHKLSGGEVFSTGDMKALRKSVMSSLKKEPRLIEEETKNKRLKKTGRTA